MENRNKSIFISKTIIFPILIYLGMIVIFSKIKYIPYDFTPRGAIGVRYLAKFIFTIILPVGLIYLMNKRRSDFGIYLPKFSDSFKLALKAFSIAGPACMAFWLVDILGWEIKSWPGSITLSVVFLMVFYFIPNITKGLPTRDGINSPNRGIFVIIFLSMLTIIVTYFTYGHFHIISKILYFTFIVGFGEELFFRGYLQSSFNRYFGKPFMIGDVKFGWGVFLAALLFGLIHALVSMPPTWPWALFTLIMGLTLGFIREKDGSILAPAILHLMLDFPLVFMS